MCLHICVCMCLLTNKAEGAQLPGGGVKWLGGGGGEGRGRGVDSPSPPPRRTLCSSHMPLGICFSLPAKVIFFNSYL
jgi:hypothetical protein